MVDLKSCLRRGYPPGRGRWHAPSPRHLRALLSVCGRCSVGGLGCCSCRVRVCVSMSGVLFFVGVCVRDLLIFLHRSGPRSSRSRRMTFRAKKNSRRA